MSDNSSEPTGRQQQFDEILADLMRAIDAGQPVDVDHWLTRYPDFSKELGEFFQEQERFEKLVKPLRQAAAHVLHVRCPHCHNPIELLEEAPIDEISCPSCGSSFSLVGERTQSHFGAGARTLGHFKLLHSVGVGQFGSVWRARDTELDRTVAVKIPRQGRLDESQTELFLRDARAAAQLNHPNIVSVHEVGRQDATIYIVSDFIQGANLKEWMAVKRLTPREVTELCVKIAEALHHAHELGVIHRDLKPGNIMMDAESQPHLVDFGLAKREAGEITMTIEGQILGTPAYMPPEQARGEGHTADRRADIYALGVIMYELLTGDLPFRGDKQMLLVQILTDDPPSPRKLDSNVPRDLETICLKCMEKNPDKRYPTAASVADELTRYLNDEPIQARPIGNVESWRRWGKRNPQAALLALAVVITLLAGTVISTSFALATSVALRNAEVANQSKDEALKAKEASLRETRRTIEKYVETVQNAELLKEKRFKPLLKELLKDALAHYERFIDQHEHDEAQLVDLSNALFLIAWISSESGDPEKAIEAYRGSIRMREKLAADDPTVEEHWNVLAKTYNNIGSLCQSTSRLDEALMFFNKARAIREQMIAAHPDESAHKDALAGNHNSIGLLFQSTGQPDNALLSFERSIAIRKELIAESPGEGEYRDGLASSYLNIGIHYRLTGQHDEALTSYNDANLIWRELVAENPNVTEYQEGLAKSYNNIALLYRSIGQPKEALASLNNAVSTWKTLMTENPTVTLYQEGLAFGYNGIGVARHSIGQTDEALVSFKKGITLRERLAEENPTVTEYRNTLARSYSNIGLFYQATGQPDESLASFKQALAISEKLVAENATITDYRNGLASIHNNLGILHNSTGQLDQAIACFKQALSIKDELASENPNVSTYKLELSKGYSNIGILYNSTGQPDKSIASSEKAIVIGEKLVAENPVSEYQEQLARSYTNIGFVYSSADRTAEALVSHKKGAEIWETLVAENPKVTAYQTGLQQSYANMGSVYYMSGRQVESTVYFNKATSIGEILVEENPTVSEARSNLGFAYLHLGILASNENDVDKALHYFGLSQDHLREILKNNPRNMQAKLYLRSSYGARGRLMQRLGRFDQAVSDLEKVLEFYGVKERGILLRQLATCLRAIAKTENYRSAYSKALRLAEDNGKLSWLQYTLARIVCIASEFANNDESLAADEKAELTDEYLTSAIRLLQTARSLGYFTPATNRNLLKTEPDFGSIRAVEAFQMLLDEIERTSTANPIEDGRE